MGTLDMNRFLQRWLIALILLSCGIPAVAQDQWVLTTSDFQTQKVNLSRVDETGFTVATEGSAARKLDFDQLLMLQRSISRGMPTSKLVLLMVNGDRIAGEPLSMTQDRLTFRAAVMGEISLPLNQVVGLIKPDAALPAKDEVRTEDALILNNGDIVRGIISDVSPTTINIVPPGAASPTLIPVGALSSALLATTAQEKPAAVRAFRLEMFDRSILHTPTLKLNGAQLDISLAGQQKSIPFAAVASIEQVNGPVVWLSSLVPVENIQTPYLGDRSRTAQMDRTVLGEPIRFGSQTVYSRGIGVHAYSRLSYDLDKSCRRFRTQYAIDGDLPWADVTVRIWLDDIVVLERKNFKAAQLPAAFTVDTQGAHTLTLEVDYGENYDVQDRFNWIEPAFLR